MTLSTSTLSLATLPSPRQQVLIVCDGASPDLFPLLRGGLHPLHAIHACRHPIEAITERLQQVADPAGVAELHLVAHGRAGAFCLGGHWIDRAGLIAAASSLACWKVTRIILWSCHTGAELDFLATLAELTGATVYASTTTLGASDSLTINPEGRIGAGFAFADLFKPSSIEAWGGSLNGSVVVDSGGLSFANGIKITSNSGNPVGTAYLYGDVYIDTVTGRRVDALITVKSTVNAAVTVFDSNTLQFDSPGLFQPNVFIRDALVGGSAEFHFQFIQGGSYGGGSGIPASSVTVVSDELRINGATPYTKVSLENVAFTAYDIDGQSGNPTAKQFVQTQKYDPLAVSVGDAVDASYVGTALRFSAKSPGDSDPNGPVFDVAEFEAHSASAGIGIMDNFNLTVGDLSNTSGSYVALYGISFGPALPASLGDFLWNDSNGNGRQDAGEFGVAGRTVTLIGGGIDGVIGTGADDSSITTTTDGSGKYVFSRLTAGIEYQVIFGDIPAGTVFTTPNVSGNALDTIDSDADPSTGQTQIITLAQGENNTSLDAGLYTPAKISGYVYQDIGNDGVRNSEPGIAGVNLQLSGTDGAGNSVTVTTTTSTSGYYEFVGLRPGTYTIRETQPVGYVDGKDTAGSPGGGSAGNDVINNIVLTSGMSSVENNFGERLLSITGYKFIDIVGDGVWGPVNPLEPGGERDPGEQGWRINLSVDTNLDGKLSDGDLLIASDTTDATGQYQFENLGPLDAGEVYIVWESPVPVGSFDTSVDWSRTFNTTGYYTLDPSLGQSITGVEGSSDLGLDGDGPGKGNFGNFRNLDLGCYKWIDINGNAVWDLGESGSNGWKIYLDDNESLDDGYIRMQTTKNDGTYDGFYEFQNITPDEINGATTLYVYEEIRPGYIKTFGGYTFGVQSGEIVSSQYGIAQRGNFGNFLPASLGDRLWLDSNGNGIQDSGESGLAEQQITLIGGGADGVIGTGGDDTTATTDTGADGRYGFSGLTPGVQYQVLYSKPVDMVFTGKDQGVNDATDSDVNTSGLSQIVTLSSGENNTSIDAGVYIPASLGDRVWLDSNGNGVQDSGEAGVSGQTVTLIGGGGNGVIGTGGDDTTVTTTTGANGLYGFSSLTPGVQYQVQFSKPTGMVFTGKDQGGNDASDSDADPVSGKTPIVTLNSGENNMTLDAGLIPATPGIKIIKDVVGQSLVAPNTPVTFSYSVTNTGGVPLAAIGLNDDNATLDFAGDDFKPAPVLQTSGQFTGKNIGDLNGDDKLDLAEIWKYSASVIPPVVMTVTVTTGATPIDSGILSYQTLSNGDVRVYYRQSSNFNDNTYGTGSDDGWTSQGKTHKFSDLTGSDKAGFLIKFSDGTTLAQFYQDYITASTTQDKALDPVNGLPTVNNEYTAYSGYRSLGWSGGDGAFLSGNSAVLKDFDTTLELNLNQPGLANNGIAYTAMTLNSPTAPAVANNDSKWDVVNGYFFTIDKSAFTSKSFGGVTIFDQHNSPAKVGGSNTYIPVIEGGASVNTATVTGIGNGTTVTDADDATVVVVTGPLGTLGDRVWFDTDADGVQDASEAGIAGVKLILTGDFNRDGNVDYTATATTGSTGFYSLTGLPAGAYTVTVDTSTLPTNYIETYDLDGLTTLNAAIGILASGQNRSDFDFGYVATAPGFSLVKTANKSTASYGEAITYTYVVNNSGSQALANVVLKDDNGTPSDAADDFVLSNPSGDAVNPGSLDPGEAWTYTKTLTPTITLGANNVNGYTGPAGQLSYQTLGNGDIRVTYRQSANVNDNTYGTGVSSGWSSHTFSDLTGSDKAGFELKDKNGATVMKFYMDYISSTTTDTDGYGANFAKYASLGVTGGDGSISIGSAANLYDFDSTLELNLNRSGYTTMIVNSPIGDSSWDAVDGYSFTVKASVFGSAGFGAASIFDQHNSPSKLGVNSFVPTLTPGIVTNTAVVSAKLAGATVVAIDDATVTIGSGATGSTKFFVTDNAVDKTFLYSSLGTSTGSFANVSGNTTPRDIASNATGDKLWVLDKNKNVTVYDGSGAKLGQWKADSQGREPEGVTLDPSIDPQTGKNDLWIADRDRKIYWYDDAASNTSGTDKAEKTFSPSISGNLKGIVTDGTYLWAVTEGASDYVYRFAINRTASTGDPSNLTLDGSWKLATVNAKPTGITLNPNGGSSLWVVDEGTDVVYEYGSGRSLTSGTGMVTTSFILGSSNLAPQGIADPITSGSVNSRDDSFDPVVSGGLHHDRQDRMSAHRQDRKISAGGENWGLGRNGRLSIVEHSPNVFADSGPGRHGVLGDDSNRHSFDQLIQSPFSFPMITPVNHVIG
jgi:hypothetical protein